MHTLSSPAARPPTHPPTCVLVPQCEQVCEVPGLEEAALAGVAQHLVCQKVLVNLWATAAQIAVSAKVRVGDEVRGRTPPWAWSQQNQSGTLLRRCSYHKQQSCMQHAAAAAAAGSVPSSTAGSTGSTCLWYTFSSIVPLVMRR
jgi:hypothetical protein